jgi:hypothetical protein
MNYKLTSFLAAVILMAWTLIPARAQDLGAPPPIPADEEPEVLTSGPMHEAYAEPVVADDDDNDDNDWIATKPPPSVIEELPPDERPEGDRYVWVPGYWAWEAEANDYIWVSACWRVAPPNMSWVPGYWNQVDRGWQWVPGFWSPVGTQEIEYLPAPPTTPIDYVAPGPAPAPDQTWVPACWYWQQGSYVRRPGYWLRQQPGWVWVPSHLVWTPRGYVFVHGHWDYPLETRGVLFAPVRFREPSRIRASFRFSPSTVVDISIVTDHLFTSPRACHYYYGDYYDDSYVKIGIFAWFDREHHRRGWYDPIYEYDRVRFHREDPRWEDRERERYEELRRNRDERPPRTYRELETRVARLPEPQRRRAEIAKPLQTVVVNNTTNVKFTQINNETRQTIAKKADDVKNFKDQRRQWETTAAASRQPARDAQNRSNTNDRNSNDRNNADTNDRRPAANTAGRDNAPNRGNAADTASNRGARGTDTASNSARDTARDNTTAARGTGARDNANRDSANRDLSTAARDSASRDTASARDNAARDASAAQDANAARDGNARGGRDNARGDTNSRDTQTAARTGGRDNVDNARPSRDNADAAPRTRDDTAARDGDTARGGADASRGNSRDTDTARSSARGNSDNAPARGRDSGDNPGRGNARGNADSARGNADASRGNSDRAPNRRAVAAKAPERVKVPNSPVASRGNDRTPDQPDADQRGRGRSEGR